MKYYGMVRGPELKHLVSRYLQHARDPAFDPAWRFDYAVIPTPAEADFIETLLIANYPHPQDLINKAKMNNGRITLFSLPKLTWLCGDGKMPMTRRHIQEDIRSLENLLQKKTGEVPVKWWPSMTTEHLYSVYLQMLETLQEAGL